MTFRRLTVVLVPDAFWNHTSPSSGHIENLILVYVSCLCVVYKLQVVTEYAVSGERDHFNCELLKKLLIKDRRVFLRATRDNLECRVCSTYK